MVPLSPFPAGLPHGGPEVCWPGGPGQVIFPNPAVKGPYCQCGTALPWNHGFSIPISYHFGGVNNMEIT